MVAATSITLFKRNQQVLPRVAAVHDLCGYGKCSLGVAIPVLSAAGCDVCPVPTSLFSAHTRFPEFYMHDTTDMLDDYLDAWAKEGIQLDAIYSGFLGAPEQVACIQRLYREHPGALKIVDPVMGDGGNIYPTYTPELCDAMRTLVDGADLLTPNLTEAAILTNTDYQGTDLDDSQVTELANKLLALGAHYVVLKGITRNDGFIRDYIAGQDCELLEVKNPLSPIMRHGTGDLYASALLGALMAEKSLADAAQLANAFVRASLEVTLAQPDNEVRGISFESCLGQITQLLA